MGYPSLQNNYFIKLFIFKNMDEQYIQLLLFSVGND